MADQEKTAAKSKKVQVKNYAGGSSPLYGLGFIGAAFYYFQHADGLEMFAVGFIKAVVWPAILVYKLIESLA